MKRRIAWYILVVTLVVPPALYFIVNLYWWLFNGGQLNVDKMFAAGCLAIVFGIPLASWAIEGEALND